MAKNANTNQNKTSNCWEKSNNSYNNGTGCYNVDKADNGTNSGSNKTSDKTSNKSSNKSSNKTESAYENEYSSKNH